MPTVPKSPETKKSEAEEKSAPEEKKDPEMKLALSHAFKDHSKSASVLEKSPNGAYLSVLDNQNRVLVLDSVSGVMLNVWKGYHHAQIAWLVVCSKDPPADVVDAYPADNKTACLLVVYLPRRGSLEVWSVERKNRIAEFGGLCKNGRLIQSHNGILDGVANTVFSRRAASWTREVER